MDGLTELVIIGGGCLGLMYFATLGMWIWRERQHDAERRELYNRLMARDLTEYTAHAPGRPPPRARNFIAAGIRKHMERQQKAGE